MAECFPCIKKILKVVGSSIAARRQIPADLVDFLFPEKAGVDCRPNLKREISIDQIINIDFMKKFGELHEVKKSKSVEEAGIWQMKYYLYYLQQRGVTGMKGKIDYPLLKKTMSVELTDEDCGEIEKIICEITQIKKRNIPPDDCNKKICKKCAYYDLCFI